MLRLNRKQAQVQGLSESRLTIRGDENQDMSPLKRFGQREKEIDLTKPYDQRPHAS